MARLFLLLIIITTSLASCISKNSIPAEQIDLDREDVTQLITRSSYEPFIVDAAPGSSEYYQLDRGDEEKAIEGVSGLSRHIDELKSKTITDPVYYMVASRKNLRENNLLDLRDKPASLNSDAGFTRCSRDHLNEIIIGAPSAEVITTHPAGSYRFIETPAGGKSSIIIVDKDQFWKDGDYLIISY